jgi:hypothetical protein
MVKTIAPSWKQRIRKIDRLVAKAEQIVAVERREREEQRAEFAESLRPRARQHAAAVAAIVLFGKPQIDEPLIHAWQRALQHLEITPQEASDEMYPIIMQSANEIERFTEIFSNGPVWVLEFTWMRLDAGVLKFGLPRMSDKQVWGEDGLRDMMRWPLLPLGMMTDGIPYPEIAVEDGVPPEEEEAYRQHRRIHEFGARPEEVRRRVHLDIPSL